MAVVVVSYNVATLLRRCLESVLDADEVVVVDNNSVDGSSELVRRDFPWVKLIANSENLGFSAAINAGVAGTSSDLILLLNPDAELQPDTLDGIRHTAGRLRDAGALGFRQIDENGLYQLSVGPRPSFLRELARMILQRSLDRGSTTLSRQVDELLGRYPRRVSWASASALLVRRAAFNAVGGFDDGFFLYFEDADFCLRLRRKGFAVYYVPNVTVIHRRGRSAAGSRELAERSYRDSQRRYWRRHRGQRAEQVIVIYQAIRRALGTRGG